MHDRCLRNKTAAVRFSRRDGDSLSIQIAFSPFTCEMVSSWFLRQTGNAHPIIYIICVFCLTRIFFLVSFVLTRCRTSKRGRVKSSFFESPLYALSIRVYGSIRVRSCHSYGRVRSWHFVLVLFVFGGDDHSCFVNDYYIYRNASAITVWWIVDSSSTVHNKEEMTKLQALPRFGFFQTRSPRSRRFQLQFLKFCLTWHKKDICHPTRMMSQRLFLFLERRKVRTQQNAVLIICTTSNSSTVLEVSQLVSQLVVDGTSCKSRLYVHKTIICRIASTS